MPVSSFYPLCASDGLVPLWVLKTPIQLLNKSSQHCFFFLFSSSLPKEASCPAYVIILVLDLILNLQVVDALKIYFAALVIRARNRKICSDKVNSIALIFQY